MDLVTLIKKIAKEKNAIILAHNYQNDEIQDIADFTGDSLELARISANNKADIIVFCGVHFMAESAVILSPDKKVILPDQTAGCDMADMATAKGVLELKAKYPEAKVVTYINSSAAVKAVTDVCCTSANAVKIVQNIDSDKIIFVPDENLGRYIKRFTDKEMIFWGGYCPVHAQIPKEAVLDAKIKNPDAIIVVHPECKADIIDIADEVLSTSGMLSLAKKTSARKIILVTEKGMVYRLKKQAPHIEYIVPSEKLYCAEMKKITLQKLYDAIVNEQPVITVPHDIIVKAEKSLTRMLELSK